MTNLLIESAKYISVSLHDYLQAYCQYCLEKPQKSAFARIINV